MELQAHHPWVHLFTKKHNEISKYGLNSICTSVKVLRSTKALEDENNVEQVLHWLYIERERERVYSANKLCLAFLVEFSFLPSMCNGLLLVNKRSNVSQTYAVFEKKGDLIDSIQENSGRIITENGHTYCIKGTHKWQMCGNLLSTQAYGIHGEYKRRFNVSKLL